jgi:hypothetical protein
MNALVTGGTGTVGRLTVARLVRGGHRVRVIGMEEEADVGDAEYHQCDITDFASVRELVRDMEGIVHLAAIPHPSRSTADALFHINCTGTFNVYQAAAEEGIKRVVSASSINALGFNFGVVPFQLSYLPIDEAHPTQTTDVYSLSKQILEDTADYFWRRDGISGVCLRLPFVFDPESSKQGRFAGGASDHFSRLAALPETERAEQIRQVWSLCEQMQRDRVAERPRPAPGASTTPEQEQAMDQRRMVMGVTNFWTSIHAEDSAQAFERGLTAEYEGSHPLFVSQAENRAGVDSEILAQMFFPAVVQKRPLRGRESLVSIERARQLIDFDPQNPL